MKLLQARQLRNDKHIIVMRGVQENAHPCASLCEYQRNNRYVRITYRTATDETVPRTIRRLKEASLCDTKIFYAQNQTCA